MADVLIAILGIGIAYVALLFPVLLLATVLYYRYQNNKNKFIAIAKVAEKSSVALSKAELEELLKKIDHIGDKADKKNSGIVIAASGLGISAMGIFNADGLGTLFGIGLLILFSGTGIFLAEFLFPKNKT